MFLFGQMGGSGGFDPLILLTVALLIDAVIGDFRVFLKLTGHPLDPFAGLASWFERKLNRTTRSQADRAIRGALVVAVLIALGVIAGTGIAWLTQNVPAAWILELLFLVVLIPQRTLFKRVRDIGRSLRDGETDPARQQLGQLLDHDPGQLDAHATARVATEVSADRYASSVVAPCFWYVLFGFPGFLVFQIVNVMHRQFGLESERYRAFGFTAARLNYVLVLLPGWIAGVFITIATLFVPTANPGSAIRHMISPGAKASTPSVLWPLGAVAGALGLALAADRPSAEIPRSISWINAGGRAQVTARDVRRSLYLFLVACLVNVVVIAALTILRFT